MNLEKKLNETMPMGKGISLVPNEKGKSTRPSLNGAMVKSLLKIAGQDQGFFADFPSKEHEIPLLCQEISKTIFQS